jgi:hypothetical protein
MPGRILHHAEDVLIARPEHFVECVGKLGKRTDAEARGGFDAPSRQRRLEGDRVCLQDPEWKRHEHRIGGQLPLRGLQAHAAPLAAVGADVCDRAPEPHLEAVRQLLHERLVAIPEDAVAIAIELVALVPVARREGLGASCAIIARPELDVPGHVATLLLAPLGIGLLHRAYRFGHRGPVLVA